MNGKAEPITDKFREAYEEAYDVGPFTAAYFSAAGSMRISQYMASRGHRAIACAQALLHEDRYPEEHTFSKDDYPETDYCFVGLVSLEDPPKHGVREAIGTLRLAGIKVMMVTGIWVSLPLLNLVFTACQAIIPKLPRPLLGRSI